MSALWSQFDLYRPGTGVSTSCRKKYLRDYRTLFRLSCFRARDTKAPCSRLLALLLPCREPGFQGKKTSGETAVGLMETMGRGEASLLQEAVFRGSMGKWEDGWEQKDEAEVAQMQIGLEAPGSNPLELSEMTGHLGALSPCYCLGVTVELAKIWVPSYFQKGFGEAQEHNTSITYHQQLGHLDKMFYLF